MLYFLSALSVMYILLMYYISLLLLPPDGFVLCYIVLLMLTSSALHRARGVTAGIRATGFAHWSLGLDMWFTPHTAQVSLPSVVIRKYTEYVADRIRISFAMRDREPPR